LTDLARHPRIQILYWMHHARRVLLANVSVTSLVQKTITRIKILLFTPLDDISGSRNFNRSLTRDV
jgi:hypothetical protein